MWIEEVLNFGSISLNRLKMFKHNVKQFLSIPDPRFGKLSNQSLPGPFLNNISIDFGACSKLGRKWFVNPNSVATSSYMYSRPS